MNADTFNTHSVTCPICHHTSILPTVGICCGLFTCPHCHTNFVISRSGHYVRDPFCFQQFAVSQMLRRESHPIARIRRDFNLTKRFSLLAVISSLLFVSLAFATTEKIIDPDQNINSTTQFFPPGESDLKSP